MRFQGQQFANKTVEVDNNQFVDCKFTNCVLRFTGAGAVGYQNCVFDRCEWMFDGPAETTIQYLAAMYQGLGPGGRDIVEGIFDSIRQGGIGHGILHYTPSPASHR